ncbi:hypothetical protein BYT27DRAFT_7339948 [Phlegmacium glaucopus]|nr:hypothetical protein BYT27DRAFT_7339948 [Phlegmacium glaucopus]
MSIPSNTISNSLLTGATFHAVQGGLHTHSYFTVEGRKGIDLLTNSIATGAFHNSSERYDPPKCHPSTRVAVLQHIMTWINDLQKLCFFMWLYGPAGAGKSAIAQSIAELCYEANLLAASFFFSRTAVGRSDESCLIPTLVYQLCLSMPTIRKYVEDIIERDPLVLSRSLEAQIRSLVVDPLRRALSDEKDAISLRSGPKLIIIDGLDECSTAKVQRYILSVLATALQQIPLPILFLIASRPEQIIRDAFYVEPLCSTTRHLALDDSYRPDDDIKMFLQSRFDEIKQNHPLRNLLPPEWPSDSDLVRLVQKSSGQFIYASMVMKYLDSPHHWPTDRLDIVFGLSNPGVDTPFAELDALYIHIFSAVQNIDRALEILSLFVLMQTKMLITPQLLENIFFLRHGDVYIILSDLHSIMDVPLPNTDRSSSLYPSSGGMRSESPSVIRIFHASLGDFLLDKSRSAQFYIVAGNAHANLTRYFLKYLSKTDLSASKDANHFSCAEAFVMHCQLSSPIPELLDDLYEFDFYRFLTTWHSSPTVMMRVSYVFDWLKEHPQKNPSGKDLYSHHLCSWHEYLKSELALLMTHSKLAQLMVTAVTLPKFLQYYPTINTRRILAIDLDEEGFDMFRSAYLPLLFPFLWIEGQEHLAKYHTMLSTFLGDPLHSKEFYIDAGKFAALATVFAKYLFGPMHGDYSDTASQNSQQSSIPDEHLACIFSCLSDCLLRASPSKSLAVLLQNNELPSVFQDTLFESHRETVAAIGAYILRCNVSELPDDNFIMDQSIEINGLNSEMYGTGCAQRWSKIQSF